MLTRLFVQRPTLAVVVITLALLAGAFAWHSLVQQEYPNVAHPTISISATYAGAPTSVMRDAVVVPIEEQVSGSPNLQHLSAIIEAGRASITATFALSSNVPADLTNVQKAVQAAQSNLPSSVAPPVVRASNPSQPHVVTIAVSSRALSPSALARVVINHLVPTLEQIAGVSKVNVTGDVVPAYEVRVHPRALAAEGLTLNDVVSSIAANNVRAPGGFAYESNRQTSVDVRGDISSPQSVSSLLIQSNSQSAPANTVGTLNLWTQVAHDVSIGQIASVRDSHEPQLDYASVEGQRSILLEVRKATSQSEVTVANNVLAALPALKAQFPQIHFKIIEVQAKVTEQQLGDVIRTLLEGVGLTALVMLLFLQSWRNAIVVMIAIPVSLAVALFVMRLLGLTIDTISLLAMTLVFGILIDGSTVVLENAERHYRELGQTPHDAAVQARAEIGAATIVLTLVDVVVFLPIAFLHGPIGRELAEFGIVVTVSTLTSLFVSFTITPGLAGLWSLHSQWRPPAPVRAFGTSFERVRRWYSSHLLNWGLRHPQIVMAIAAASFGFAMLLVPTGVVGEEFIPPQDRGEIYVQLAYPVGTPLQTTKATLLKLERAVDRIPDLRSETTVAGRYSAPFGHTVSESNVGQIHLFLHYGRHRSTDFWVHDLRTLVAQQAPAAHAVVIAASGTGGGSVQPIDEIVSLRSGQDPTPYARRVFDALASMPGTINVSSSARRLTPQLSVVFNRAMARMLDVSIGDAATAVEAAFGGAIASQFSTTNGLVYIQVIYPLAHLHDPRAILEIPMRALNGSIVHVGDIARLRWTPAPPLIVRQDRADVVHVNADVASGYSLSSVQHQLNARIAALHLPPFVSVHATPNGQQARMKEVLTDLGGSLILSLILVFLLMVALYDSYLSPFIIMFAVPVAVFGALGALALTHQTLNLFSLIGCLMLIGIVTKNGILLVDYANTLRRHGAGRLRAIKESARARFRPIVMTTVSMIAAMTPLALALEPGSQVRQSLGIVVIGGMSSSLLLTLVLVPVMYMRFAPKEIRHAVRPDARAVPSVQRGAGGVS
ncbi:MAG: efflux RND transporter permease subunit [Candidatus Tyrphobacter sp.]